LLTGLLGVARDYLDFVGEELVLPIDLEFDVLDQESPNIIAESVCLEVALRMLAGAQHWVAVIIP
jgi:hypothetical protein